MGVLRSRQTLLALLIFALLTLAVFWRFFEGDYLAGSDAMGPLADLEMMKVDSSYFSAWRDITALGYPNYPSPTLSGLFYLFTGMLGVSPAALWKALIIGAFFMAGAMMYLTARSMTGNFLASLVAGLVYSLNQVFLSQVLEVHHFFVLGYALFPLLFLMLYRTINGTGKWSVVALPAMAIAYGTVGAPHTILITAVFLVLFILTYAWMRRKGGREWIRILGSGAACVLLVVLPLALTKYTGAGGFSLEVHYSVEEAGMYSSYSLYHAFVLASSENTFVYGAGGQWTYPAILWPVGLAVALVVPVTALLSLKLRSHKALVLSLLVPALIFVVLAAGPHFPNQPWFALAFSNVPLMDSIRAYSRFGLLSGFSIAILIALVLANSSELSGNLSKGGRWARKAAKLVANRRFLALIVVFALMFPSAAVFLDDSPRSFDLGSSYSEPYLWMQGQEDDFRILNLPFQNVYYDVGEFRTDGYPPTMTLDVGMYSSLLSHKPYAYGVETQDYWSFLGYTLAERSFGYRTVPQMLGGTGSVRYVVAQVQSSPAEVDLFSSLDGMEMAQALEGGAKIYENQMWTPRVRGLDDICLVSGPRGILPVLTGLGLVNLTREGTIMAGQLSTWAELDEYMDRAKLIMVPDADLLEVAGGVAWDGGQIIDLGDLANLHSTDSEAYWVRSAVNYSNGVATGLTADTIGRNDLRIETKELDKGTYDLMLQVIHGPDAGRLSISVDGEVVANIDPYSPALRQEWSVVENLTLGASSHTVTISSDGTGSTSIGRLIIAPHAELQSRKERVASMLDEHREKLCLVVPGSASSLWEDGTSLPWMGREGRGVGANLTVTATDLSGAVLRFDDRAYNGQLADIGKGGQASTVAFRGIIPGQYTVTLSTIQNGSAASGKLEVWAGNGTTMSLIEEYGVEAGPGRGSYEQTYKLAVSEGMDRVQFKVRAGEAGLAIDRLSMQPAWSLQPKLTVDVPVAGDYYINVAGAGPGDILTVDGQSYAPRSVTGQGSVYLMENMSRGQHDITTGSSGVYALSLSSSQASSVPSSPQITYERLSNTEYRVHVVADRPVWVQLSNTYHALWSAEMDGRTLDHKQVDSMVNAFFVPEPGEHSITIRFQGQDDCSSMLLCLLIALLIATAVAAISIFPHRRHGRER